MDSILEGLNAAQRAAVTSPSNVLQILAPPGSGKTKTLTSRVAYLLQHYGFKPWNIICLTFTIKSSREMKARITKLIGNGIESRLILGTFHSVCRRYLVTYGHLIGIPKGFGISDSSDTISIIKRIVRRLRLNIDPKKAQSRISGSKSKGIGCEELAQEAAKVKNVDQQEFVTVFEAYQYQLASSNLLDYDDLLLRCVDLLRAHPTCVSNVEAVLIDEFQDTNIVQFDLMRLFAAKYKRITTVGDPDQSIYGWRSAEIKNLKRMQTQYPDTLVIHLEDNYRSSGAIILAAREVIEQDESRPSKPLLPTHCPGTVPVLRRIPSAETEALWVVTEIRRMTGRTGRLFKYADFAILLRSASLSRLLESAMGKAGIPYRMVGGQRFFDRIEIKILLDYLRVVSQPSNNDALVRILNVPSRGIGTTTSKALLEEAEEKGVSLWKLMRGVIHGIECSKTRLSKTAEQGLGSLMSIILTIQSKMSDSRTNNSPEDLLRHLIKKVGIRAFLERSHTDDHEARWANVEELVAQACDSPILIKEPTFEEPNEDTLPTIDGLQQENGNASEEALSRFLANVALASELQREDDDCEGNKPQSQVTISTIHAAKGLEWPVVFVPSAYEGCIPHSRAEDTNEERRLLYVAMTRAQALLYISCPIRNSQREETTLSPFLSPNNIGHFLTNQGPNVNSNTVVDIARILRRDFPSETDMHNASGTLPSLHDDLWPLNGEKTLEDSKVRTSIWDQTDSGDTGRRVFKRPWTKDSGKDRRMPLINKNITTSVGYATTMQSISTFSCIGSNGFTSAAEQLCRQDTEAEKSQKDGVSRKLKKGLAKGGESQIGDKFGRHNGQGNLLQLWGMKTEPKVEGVRPLAALEMDGRESMAIQKYIRNPEAVIPSSLSVSMEQTIHQPRKILSVIPQTLAAHRLQPIINKKRPRRPPDEDMPVKKQYVFLSSSPPAPETLLEEADAESAPDTRPTKTFHATSATNVQIASTVPKRTLGVRRNMNGWAPQANPGFSIPKMRLGTNNTVRP